MKQTRSVEITVGLFIAAGLVALFFLAMQVSNLAAFSSENGYNITARFVNIGGLKTKAPVTMAGVTVGRVTGIRYDKDTFEAVVSMNISPEYDRIPEDSFAKILTAGLLGEKYIGLDPGGSDLYLSEGGELTMTQSSLVLEEIIGQFIFSKAQEGAGG